MGGLWSDPAHASCDAAHSPQKSSPPLAVGGFTRHETRVYHAEGPAQTERERQVSHPCRILRRQIPHPHVFVLQSAEASRKLAPCRTIGGVTRGHRQSRSVWFNLLFPISKIATRHPGRVSEVPRHSQVSARHHWHGLRVPSPGPLKHTNGERAWQLADHFPPAEASHVTPTLPCNTVSGSFAARAEDNLPRNTVSAQVLDVGASQLLLLQNCVMPFLHGRACRS